MTSSSRLILKAWYILSKKVFIHLRRHERLLLFKTAPTKLKASLQEAPKSRLWDALGWPWLLVIDLEGSPASSKGRRCRPQIQRISHEDNCHYTTDMTTRPRQRESSRGHIASSVVHKRAPQANHLPYPRTSGCSSGLLLAFISYSCPWTFPIPAPVPAIAWPECLDGNGWMPAGPA